MNTASYADTLEERGLLAGRTLKKLDTHLTSQLLFVEDEAHQTSPHGFVWGLHPDSLSANAMVVSGVSHGIASNMLGLLHRSAATPSVLFVGPDTVVPLVMQQVQRNLIRFKDTPTSVRDLLSELLTTEYSMSPFDELHAIRADDSLFKEEIVDISKKENLPYAEKLGKRLSVLLQYFKEDYDGRSLSRYSLKGLKQFLFSNDVTYPSITAVPNGDMYAQWKSPDKSHVLSVHFFSDFSVKFFIIQPNNKHSKLDTLSGQTTVDSLAEYLNKYGVMSWIKI